MYYNWTFKQFLQSPIICLKKYLFYTFTNQLIKQINLTTASKITIDTANLKLNITSIFFNKYSSDLCFFLREMKG